MLRLAVVAGMFLLALGGHADESEVTIVLSSPAEPYRVAAAACRERYDKAVPTILVGDLTAPPTTPVVVAIGSPAAAWLNQRLAPGQVMVHCLVTPEVHHRLVTRPGRLGLAAEVPTTVMLADVRRLLPRARRIGFLYRSRTTASERLRREVVAATTDLELVAVDLDRATSAAEAIDRLLDAGPDLVLAAPDAAVYDAGMVRAVLLAALRRRVPVYGYSWPMVRAGALAGSGIDPAGQGQAVADLVSRILAGDDAPMMTREPARFLNLTVAAKLGVAIDPVLVAGATRTVGDRR